MPMKKLLFIPFLLISVMSYGQKIPESQPSMKGSAALSGYPKILFETRAYHGRPVDDVIIRSNFETDIIKLYKEYKTVCYNDSVKAKDHFPKTLYCDGTKYDDCPVRYKHRKPTFDGFMDWLEKRK